MSGTVNANDGIDAAKADAMLGVMRDAGAADASSRVTYLEQLQGGWSRHSYAARVDHGDGEERAYIVRARPRATTLDTDLGQEFRTFALLQDVDLATPDVHGFTPDEGTPFGGPFFVMDRLPGEAVNVWRSR